MAKVWTKETIRETLATSTIMVERSLLKLYARQTSDEQAAKTTSHSNGQGFNGTDANILTSFAQWIEKGAQKNIPEGKRLSEKQLIIARKKLAKYAGQLLEEVH
jgi:hypothetical protein